MGFGIELLLALIILLNGARTDLLDLLPTNAYWQAKRITVSLEQLERDAGPDQPIAAIDSLVADLASPEFKTRSKAKAALRGMGPSILPQLQPALVSKTPEVKAAAVELAREFEAKMKERSVRQLMAIRTLGERKEKGALPLLKSLVDSKEMFVPEYAARAIARIQGAAWSPPDRSAAIRNDFQLLPRHTAIVGQTTGVALAPLSLENLVAEVDPAAQPDAAQDAAKFRAETLARATDTFLQIVERTGNIRVDGLTFALSEDAGENSGWEIVILRGQFDAAALLAATRTLARPADGVVRYSTEQGIPVVQNDVDTSIMFPSDQMAIVVMADEEKDRIARMIALAYALKAGHGAMTADQDLGALLKTVDTTAPLWLAGTLNEEEKRARVLEGIDSFALSGKREKDALNITLHVTGADAEKLKASADEFDTDLRWAKQALPQTAALVPIAGFLNSVHATVGAAAKSATATAEIKSDLSGALLVNFLPLLDFKIDDNPQQNPLNVPAQPIAVPAP